VVVRSSGTRPIASIRRRCPTPRGGRRVGARGAANRLLHQRAAHAVGTRHEADLRELRAHLDRSDMDVLDPGPEGGLYPGEEARPDTKLDDSSISELDASPLGPGARIALDSCNAGAGGEASIAALMSARSGVPTSGYPTTTALAASPTGMRQAPGSTPSATPPTYVRPVNGPTTPAVYSFGTADVRVGDREIRAVPWMHAGPVLAWRPVYQGVRRFGGARHVPPIAPGGASSRARGDGSLRRRLRASAVLGESVLAGGMGALASPTREPHEKNQEGTRR
jgi:hypothetical protein